MNDYSLRKIYVWPATKFGFFIGAVLGIFPGLILGVISGAVADAARNISGMYGGLLNGVVPGMNALASRGSGFMSFLTTFLVTILFTAVVYAVTAAIVALIYNGIAAISGGLRVRAETLTPAPVSPQISPVPMPAPVFPAPAPVPQSALPAAAVAGAAWGVQQQPVQPVPVPQQAPAAYPQAAPAAVQPAAPGVQTPVRPRLVSTLHPDVELPLEATVTRLGSAPENDIVLPGAAPKHAEIRIEDGRAVLYDLSGGQTWVQGRPVRDANMLKDNFKVQFGPQEMIYRAN